MKKRRGNLRFQAYSMKFDGAVLRRGFRLYVWRIAPFAMVLLRWRKPLPHFYMSAATKYWEGISAGQFLTQHTCVA